MPQERGGEKNNATSCVRYFLFFTQMIALQKLWKTVFTLLHLKTSFVAQIFVFPFSPVFLLFGHCFRGWFKINLKIYDVINCLTKNLITHFVWYFEKEKRYDIETLFIDGVLNRIIFMEEWCKKYAPKASLRLLFHFGK